jgi:antitoxin YefM
MLGRVNEDHEPVLVTQPNGRAAMVFDADDYASMMETMHLLRSPTSVKRLQRGMAQYRKGQRKSIDVETYLN